MRSLVVFTLLMFAVPAAANSGNSVAPADQAKKNGCAKPSPSESRNAQRIAQRGDCRPAKSVPWIIDPTPLFIL